MKSHLIGLNLLLLGPTGVGKTTMIKSWIDSGIVPMCIFTEPSYEVLGKDLCKHGGIHWHYIPPLAPSFTDMIDSARRINTFDLKGLSGMTDINKRHYTGFIDVLTQCNNFKCEGCNQEFGGVDTWNTDRVLVIDSLSGLNSMAMNLVVGSKPVKSMSDWGIAMDNLERFIQKLCVDKSCHFMLTGHVEKELDEVTGMQSTMVSTLGRKMAPRLPRFFSDVVMAERKVADFTWSTVTMNADLKARNLPYAAGQKPSIAPLLESWKGRGGTIEATASVQEPAALAAPQ